jgi:hypothetical protein
MSHYPPWRALASTLCTGAALMKKTGVAGLWEIHLDRQIRPGHKRDVGNFYASGTGGSILAKTRRIFLQKSLCVLFFL